MRCKACNNVLKDEEIIWRADVGIFEDLCRGCRSAIFNTDDDVDIESLGLDIAGDNYERDE